MAITTTVVVTMEENEPTENKLPTVEMIEVDLNDTKHTTQLDDSISIRAQPKPL
jgi:microcompartment protein CcmK/EutM